MFRSIYSAVLMEAPSVQQKGDCVISQDGGPIADCSNPFRYVLIDFFLTLNPKHVLRLPPCLLTVLFYCTLLCVFSVYPETVHICECLSYLQSISNGDTYRYCCVMNNNVEISARECELKLHFFHVQQSLFCVPQHDMIRYLKYLLCSNELPLCVSYIMEYSEQVVKDVFKL